MADEYIRKADAIDDLHTQLMYRMRSDDMKRRLDDWVKTLPSADVVQVVRCKDCKFYTSIRPDIKTGICDLNVHHMGDDGFCSCGERREE